MGEEVGGRASTSVASSGFTGAAAASHSKPLRLKATPMLLLLASRGYAPSGTACCRLSYCRPVILDYLLRLNSMHRGLDDPRAAFPMFIIIRYVRRDTDVEGASMVRLTRPPKPQLRFFFSGPRPGVRILNIGPDFSPILLTSFTRRQQKGDKRNQSQYYCGKYACPACSYASLLATILPNLRHNLCTPQKPWVHEFDPISRRTDNCWVLLRW